MASEKKSRPSAPTSSLEVETKFAASDSAVAPNFDFIPLVASSKTEVRQLSAIYLDTEDLRLTRAKHTLRRRTGGPDEGWHLKAPGEGGRMEYAVGLEAGSVTGTGAEASYDVPAELVAPVRSLIRNHPLRPIAQVDNERHVTTVYAEDGTAMAEFADDHVMAASLLDGGQETLWREWEIELLGEWASRPEGEALMAAMSQVCLVAGATPSQSPSKLATALGESVNTAPVPPQPAELPKGTPGRTVVDALAANVAKLVAYDPKVRADEFDSVHQMRVATREIRSHLQTFHGIVVGEQIGELEAKLKELAGVLGVARDAEVVAMRWEELLDSPVGYTLGAELRENLVADVYKDYRRAHRRVVSALNSQEYFRVLDDLEALLADPPIASPEHTAAAAGVTPAAEAESEQGADHTDAESEASAAPEQPEAPLDTTAVLTAHLRKAFKRLLRRHKAAVRARKEAQLPEAEIDELFHEVRKAAKKLRYSAEAAGNAGLPTAKVYKACKDLQTVLGDFQDACTARDFVRSRAERAYKSGKDTFGYGVLFQLERAEGLKALEGYDAAMAQVVRAFVKMDKKISSGARSKAGSRRS